MNDETVNALNTMFDIDATNETSVVVTPEIVSASPVPATPDESEEERQAREDFQFSRGAIKAVAVEAQTTLHRAVEVADQTDTPRSFEAVAQMVRATLDAHESLAGLHEKAAQSRATKTATPAGNVQIEQGIVFNGTAAELLKLIDPTRK